MILILNGASSSGKTTLVRALQQSWPTVLLHLGTDFALQMLPQRYVGTAESAAAGFRFCQTEDQQGALMEVRVGPLGHRLEQGLARCAEVLDADGHDVALDLVVLDEVSMKAYARALHARRAYFIGLNCDLAALEARELARADRFQNLARSQYRRVHAFREYYDLELDSTARGPRDLANDVLGLVARQPAPEGLSRLAEKLGCI